MKMAIFSAFLLALFLFRAAPCFGGKRCAVVDFKPYERPGIGYEDGFYFQIVEKCIEVTIRNTGDRYWFATDITITASFDNGDVRKGAINGEKDRLRKAEPGTSYATTVCFGADPAQIRKADCNR